MKTSDNPDIQAIIDRIPEQWGKHISIGNGWYEIVIKLNKRLAEIDPNYEVHQVKEKFGGLRYYCSLESDERGKLYISEAMTDASATCDGCGNPGQLASKVWMRTVCTVCDKQ